MQVRNLKTRQIVIFVLGAILPRYATANFRFYKPLASGGYTLQLQRVTD